MILLGHMNYEHGKDPGALCVHECHKSRDYIASCKQSGSVLWIGISEVNKVSGGFARARRAASAWEGGTRHGGTRRRRRGGARRR
uniref:Uncharacterized protein n=1 Tax=Arundo donax TaxID=35708 RepID=A0A0A9G0D5_ARUDO